MNKYKQYRNNYATNIVFDPVKANLSKYVLNRDRAFPVWFSVYSDSSVEVSLDVIQIYFDTATYDEIEKDVKVISQSLKFYQFPHFSEF